MKLFGKKKDKVKQAATSDVEKASAPSIAITDSKKEPLISKSESSAAEAEAKASASFSSTRSGAGAASLAAASSTQVETGAPTLSGAVAPSSDSGAAAIQTATQATDAGAVATSAAASVAVSKVAPSVATSAVADSGSTVRTGGPETIATNDRTRASASDADEYSYASESASYGTNTSSLSGGSGKRYDEPVAPRDGEDWIPTKIPNIRSKAAWKSFMSKCATPLSALAGANSAVKVGVVGLVASVILLAFANSQQRGPVIAYDADLSVAFIGNSYMFVNDLPRLLESMSDGHLFQDSCLHGSGSILKILKTGNGMYNRWQTNEAIVNINYDKEDNGEERRQYQQQLYYENDKILYDFGACSVPQLLLGYDDSISYGNQYGNFYNDGNNPCLKDDDYLDYMNSFNYTDPWDFVVITDQSKRMCFEDARNEALQGLNYTYVPLLNQTRSVPVIVQPHAFNSSSVNMTGLGDIPTFTAMIYEGAVQYQKFLRKELPSYSQRARLAPVGMAYLTVWEEDYQLWEKLFLYDDIHPTTYGSYLYGLVVFATIYNVMPWKEAVLLENMAELWMYARKKQLGNYTYPDYDEAAYLFDVAKRVALKGYVPSSFPNLKSSSSSISTNATDDSN